MGKFVGLHNHSEYSTLDGLSTVSQMAKRAKSLDQFATAITDHGDCFPAGTRIRMADGGHKLIEFMKAGDMVLTAEGNIGRVNETFTRSADNLKRLVAWGHRELVATAEHPILTKRGYVKLEDLTAVDWVAIPRYLPGNEYYLDTTRIWKKVRRVEDIETNSVKVYNLSVEGDNSYVANGVGVHNCGGHLVFETACKNEGVKPIFGMEGYLVDSISQARAEKQKSNDFSHIVLLAKNQVGLKNLWKISSRAYIEGFYYKPLADWEMFKEHSEGLYATSACLMSYMAKAILKDDEQRCHELLGKYLDVFGENFFLELHTWQFMNPEGEKQEALNAEMSKVNQGLVELSKSFSIPLTVVNDAHYTIPEHYEHHNLVWNMSTGNSDQNTEGRGQTTGHMMDDEEVLFWMRKHGVSEDVTRQAIENTNIIAQNCDVEIQRGKYIPTLTDSIESDREIFYQKLQEGFTKKVIDRGLDVEKYKERMFYEAEIICSKDFDSYFLIVADYVAWCKSEGMLIGAGRGSGGGSLLAYLLGITEIDPVRYNLAFERFLNPFRKGLPDFDVDFPQSRRQDVIKYIEGKYGKDKVCFIGNYSRRGPKAILKDLCRAMKIPFEDSEAMRKVIENVLKGLNAEDSEDDDDQDDVEWQQVIDSPELKGWADRYPDLFKKIRDMVGGIRSTGTHASGVLIASQSLTDLIPLRIKKKSGSDGDFTITTQFENKTSSPDNMEVEDFGFVKFDILGLRHLDTLTRVNELVNQTSDPSFYYNFDDSMYRDPAPWSLVSSGKTLGVFQLETDSMSAVGKSFKPTNEYEMSDLISVNRPGLVRSGNLQEYLNRRNGIVKVSLRHPLLEKITKKTYGMFVYQEQIMFAVQALANYSLAEADNIRKIMGKKHQEELRKMKPDFVSRCLKNPEFTSKTDSPKQVAEAIWDDMEYFGSYSFNQAHAMCYGFISCWGIYMKYYHPLEYWAACLATDESKTVQYLREVRKAGFKVLPPDINESGSAFTVVPEGVRYGLSAIRGAGPSAVKEILAKRPFTSLADLRERTVKTYVKATTIKSLIEIGAFDSLDPDRAELLYTFLFDTRKKKTDSVSQIPNFKDEETLLRIEKEIVGDFITKDPLLPYAEVWEEMITSGIDNIDDLEVGLDVVIGGVVTRIKSHQQNNGKKMVFLEMSCDQGTYSIPVFNFKYEVYESLLDLEAPILCSCKVNEYKGKKGLSLQEIYRLDRIL